MVVKTVPFAGKYPRRDAIPRGMCRNCGLIARHLGPADCIDALRSRSADLECRLNAITPDKRCHLKAVSGPDSGAGRSSNAGQTLEGESTNSFTPVLNLIPAGRVSPASLDRAGSRRRP